MAPTGVALATIGLGGASASRQSGGPPEVLKPMKWLNEIVGAGVSAPPYQVLSPTPIRDLGRLGAGIQDVPFKATWPFVEALES